jgi:hypothetical protein
VRQPSTRLATTPQVQQPVGFVQNQRLLGLVWYVFSTTTKKNKQKILNL